MSFKTVRFQKMHSLIPSWRSCAGRINSSEKTSFFEILNNILAKRLIKKSFTVIFNDYSGVVFSEFNDTSVHSTKNFTIKLRLRFVIDTTNLLNISCYSFFISCMATWITDEPPSFQSSFFKKVLNEVGARVVSNNSTKT